MSTAKEAYLWQATSDFAGGQYLKNPYFESRCFIFKDPEDVKCQYFERKDDDDLLGVQRFRELLSPHPASGTLDVEARPQSGTSDVWPRQFPSSITGSQVIKQDAASGECKPHTCIFNSNSLKVPGILRSMSKSGIAMSKSGIANHIGHHIYRQMYSGNVPAADGGDDVHVRLCIEVLQESVHRLISSQHEEASDVSVADVLTYLQSEIEQRAEDMPASSQHPSLQPAYNFSSANVQSSSSSFGNVAAALNS